MAELTNSLVLWTVNRHGTALVLGSGPTGTPQPIQPAPLLYKASYVGRSTSDADLAYARQELTSPSVPLLARLPGPDGPPAHIALLFGKSGDETISYEVTGRPFHSIPSTKYRAVGQNAGYAWEEDLRSGHLGYFLVGSDDEANLWRIVRSESDHAARRTFTLTPVALGHGLPLADFSMITNEAIRTETERNWLDLGHALVGNRYVAAVTSAKQIAENLLCFFLLRDGHIEAGNHEMSKLLTKLQTVLGSKDTRDTAPFKDLDYHLMQKLRILHGSTHIGRTLVKGRAISPELGLTVATDLVEVLRSVGIVADRRTT